MMTDLIKRFDQYIKTSYFAPNEVCTEALAALRKQADEIERLREAIEFAHSEGFEWPSDPLPPSVCLRR